MDTLKKQMGYKYPIFSVVLTEFQTTHLCSNSNPSNFWVTMPNYFAVNLTSHTQLLQPAFTMVILPFKVMVYRAGGAAPAAPATARAIFCGSV